MLFSDLICAGIVETSGALWKENRTTVLTILKSFGMGKNVMAEKVEEEARDDVH